MLWIIWFSNSFAYYGLVILTPAYFQVRSDQENEPDPEFQVFLNTLITSAAEFPGLLLAAYLVDKYVFVLILRLEGLEERKLKHYFLQYVECLHNFSSLKHHLLF